jgi:hypothetical protein
MAIEVFPVSNVASPARYNQQAMWVILALFFGK